MRDDYRRIGKRGFYETVRRYETRKGGLAFETPVHGFPPRVDWRHNGDLIGYVIKTTTVRADDTYWIDRRLLS